MAHNDLMYAVNVHSNCVCNEMRALTNRHLVDRSYIPFDREFWYRICRKTMKFYPKGVRSMTFREVCARYTGDKKRLYVKAALELQQHGLLKKHSTVKMFVKPDRYPEDDCSEKDPRAIQYRSPHFNLVMGSYIFPYEHLLYEQLKMGSVSGTRVIAKGLNPYQRAKLFREKASHFVRPKYLMFDHSRFDSTINVDHLATTHKRYMRAFKSKTLNSCLRAQLRNVGYSKGGIKYRTTGTRMSGDVDTGCGNSIVNANCLWAVLHYSGIEKFDYLLDGDDSIVVIEQDDFTKLKLSLFARCGFDTKFDHTNDINKVEFCQSRLVGDNFVRKPLRVMSHTTVMRKVEPAKRVSGWLKAVGMCELAMNQGVPIIQSYAAKLASLQAKPLFDPEMMWRMGDLKPTHKTTEVTAEARHQFALAFGVPEYLQVALEQQTVLTYNFTSNFGTLVRGVIRRRRAALLEHECRTSRYWAIFASREGSPKRSASPWWCSG